MGYDLSHDSITPISIEVVTTHIITVDITIDTVTTGVIIYIGPGFPGLLAIIAIGKRIRTRTPSCTITHFSKSPLCSCVSITLPDSS
jgi:hypothetical protein